MAGAQEIGRINYKLDPMLINRRVALKQLGIITGGVLLLPSCVKQARAVSVSLKHITITGDQEALLAEVAETILPATDIPGAKGLDVPSFVLRMVDDCYDAGQQKSFMTGLTSLEEEMKKKTGKTFTDSDIAARETFLKGLEEERKKADEAQTPPSDLATFYGMTKRHTVQGFLNSKYIMTNVLVHKMIPGRFDGCVEIKDKNDIQTIIG
jgi:hypothetical protein